MIKMYKIICTNSDCAKNGEIYYFQNIASRIECGTCKTELQAKEMTASEIKEIFDYDLTD